MDRLTGAAHDVVLEEASMSVGDRTGLTAEAEVGWSRNIFFHWGDGGNKIFVRT